MKNLAALTTMIVLTATGVTTSSCKKEVTQVVNQAFSVTYTINPGDWKVVTGTNNNNINVTLNVPEIDNVVVANGGVIVYLSFDNGTTFEAVPEEYLGISYNALHYKGSLYIEGHALDNSNVTPPTAGVLAKVVIVDAKALQ